MTKPFGKENVYEDKTFVIFIPVTFLVACEGTDLIEPDNVSKEQISTQIIYNPTKYSKQKVMSLSKVVCQQQWQSKYLMPA